MLLILENYKRVMQFQIEGPLPLLDKQAQKTTSIIAVRSMHAWSMATNKDLLFKSGVFKIYHASLGVKGTRSEAIPDSSL
jgi:hypothetical protein